MEQKEIKDEVDLMYKQISDAQERLIELRKICKHPTTYQGNYSWRIGSMFLAELCSDCGHVVKNLDLPPIFINQVND